MKNFKFILSSVLFYLLNQQLSLSQVIKDSVQYRIETSDGNEFLGTIVSKDSISVTINTEKLGTLTIKQKYISTITPVSAIKTKNGNYWFDNPQATRYLISGNGYGLKSGEAYYQNAWILFNQFNIGITNNVSIGAGLFPTFLFASTNIPIWLTPKVTFPVVKDKINVGVGAFIGTVTGQENTGFGLLYGVSTFGSRDKNLSIGLGYGYEGGSLAKRPLISLSGMIRTDPRGYFISENYMFESANETIFILSIGGRRLIKRVGLDYGLFIPVYKELTNVIAIPWLGLLIPLNK